jgi:hypothetical protein
MRPSFDASVLYYLHSKIIVLPLHDGSISVDATMAVDANVKTFATLMRQHDNAGMALHKGQYLVAKGCLCEYSTTHYKTILHQQSISD